VTSLSNVTLGNRVFSPFSQGSISAALSSAVFVAPQERWGSVRARFSEQRLVIEPSFSRDRLYRAWLRVRETPLVPRIKVVAVYC